MHVHPVFGGMGTPAGPEVLKMFTFLCIFIVCLVGGGAVGSLRIIENIRISMHFYGLRRVMRGAGGPESFEMH